MNEMKKILVAGDVCLDVIAIRTPPPVTNSDEENWKLTGETQIHYLQGGSMLLTEWVQEAMGTEKTWTVIGPRPESRDSAGRRTDTPLDKPNFLARAMRLCRDDMVHSLLEVSPVDTDPDDDKKGKTLRVEREAGYSGPEKEETLWPINYEPAEDAEVVVLDDTGNHFRKNPEHNPWPAIISSPSTGSGPAPWIVYKLNRPLPGEGTNELWDEVKRNHPDRRLVIISVDDMRKAGVPISQGLSWERTALDVVWQLLNAKAFEQLLECRLLVIRLGLDGAILWRRGLPDEKKPLGRRRDRAWLIYDPSGIEGGFRQSLPGGMVGAGSAFTAALAKAACSLGKIDEDQPNSDLVNGIMDGLRAGRHLHRRGFGDETEAPEYPREPLFKKANTDKKAEFSCQEIRIIPQAQAPDRSGWRLLDEVFKDKSDLLHKAVLQQATGKKPIPPEDSSNGDSSEQEAYDLLKEVPLGKFGKLCTYDRREIEMYRSVRTLLLDYLRQKASRPLSFAVFGPPGAGKSFGVKEVANSLKKQRGCPEVQEITFNLSLYQTPEELAGAFHLVRDIVLEGKIPLVFFDEFDTALGKETLGWLRHFLAPMQDGQFLDRGAPHPIGQAIFVFAGGTSSTFREFSCQKDPEFFKMVKGPDFLSRLRATLDIPSLNLMSAHSLVLDKNLPTPALVQPEGTYDPFGPIESLPSEGAILLRRATILNFNLKKKARKLIRADKSLGIHPTVLSALLFMPSFKHGNRSFEALLDMSHLGDSDTFHSSMLPAAFQLPLHVDEEHFGQLLDVSYPFESEDRQEIARFIHVEYLAKEIEYDPSKAVSGSRNLWDDLEAELRESNLGQADNIAIKLRTVKLWFRPRPKERSEAVSVKAGQELLKQHVEYLAQIEHDRWCAEKRLAGWIAGENTKKESKVDPLYLHNCLFPWKDLSEETKNKDRDPVCRIPELLALANLEIIKPAETAPCRK